LLCVFFLLFATTTNKADSVIDQNELDCRLKTSSEIAIDFSNKTDKKVDQSSPKSATTTAIEISNESEPDFDDPCQSTSLNAADNFVDHMQLQTQLNADQQRIFNVRKSHRIFDRSHPRIH
jgi:hypothetical protein